jgi:hypothetical protein
MKRIVRLTESDLTRIVRRVIMEQAKATPPKINGVEIGSGTINNIGFNIIGDSMIEYTDSKVGPGKIPGISAHTTPWSQNKWVYGVRYNCNTKEYVLYKQGGGQQFLPSTIKIPNAESLCLEYKKFLSTQPKPKK